MFDLSYPIDFRFDRSSKTFKRKFLSYMQKRSESEHADIDIGNQVADINLEMLP